MYLVGLTGGIAAGKSSVAERWADLGASIIDADELAREVVAPGTPALAAIVGEWGETLLDESAALRRDRLAAIVFEDEDARKRLEAIVHPAVQAETRARLAALPADAIAVYVVPLLVEANVDHPFDFVVTVEAPEGDQIERMVKHRGMTREAAIARIRAQASPAQRANRADVILNSNQAKDLLLHDASQLWQRIEQQAAAKADAAAQGGAGD